MTDTTFFTDSVALAVRPAEVPEASFVNGMNAGGSCAPGVGINIAGGEIIGTPEQFTLLDQDGDIRVPQVSQSLGGEALNSEANYPLSGGVEGKGVDPVLTGTTQTDAAKEGDPALDGVPVITGDANLQTLLAGWVDTAI